MLAELRKKHSKSCAQGLSDKIIKILRPVQNNKTDLKTVIHGQVKNLLFQNYL